MLLLAKGEAPGKERRWETGERGEGEVRNDVYGGEEKDAPLRGRHERNEREREREREREIMGGIRSEDTQVKGDRQASKTSYYRWCLREQEYWQDT